MELTKFVVSVSIALVLVSFLSHLVVVVYPMPQTDYTSMYSGSSGCYDIITEQCSSYTTYSNEYYDCTDQAYGSKEYTDCLDEADAAYTNYYDSLTSGVENYQLIMTIILGVMSGILIILGFLMLNYSSIGNGLLLGGVLLFLFGSFFTLVSGIIGLSSSLIGASSIVDQGVKALDVVSLLLEAIVLTLLIVFAYLKVDKQAYQQTANYRR